MKKLVLPILILSALAARALAGLVIVDGAENYVQDNNGKGVSATDGYIVTFWYAATASDPLTIAHAASFFADADYGPDALGLFEQARFRADDRPDGESIYIEARIFQYDPNLVVTEAYVNALNASGNFQPLANFWDLIQGTEVSQGVLTWTGTMDEQGRSTNVTLNPAVHTLSGIAGTLPGGGQVPEPSTYAALAGLAMLAFVAARRVRR